MSYLSIAVLGSVFNDVARFRKLEAEEKVRFRAVLDECQYDYGDAEDQEETNRQIERDGVWVYFTEVKTPDGQWETAGNIGSVIGELKLDDGFYGTELAREALGLYDALVQEAADEMSQRGTYAGVAP